MTRRTSDGDEVNERTTLLPRPVAAEASQAAAEQNDDLKPESPKPTIPAWRGVLLGLCIGVFIFLQSMRV